MKDLRWIAVMIIAAMCVTAVVSAQQTTGKNTLTINGYTVTFGSSNYGTAKQGNGTYYIGNALIDKARNTIVWTIGIYKDNTNPDPSDRLRTIMSKGSDVELNTVVVKPYTIDGKPGAIGTYKFIGATSGEELTSYQAYYSPMPGVNCYLTSSDLGLFTDMIKTVHVDAMGYNPPTDNPFGPSSNNPF